MMKHPATGCCFITALALALVADAAAAPAPTPEKPRVAGTGDQVRKELEKLIAIEFTEQTLESAINLLREETKLNLALDRITLAQNGIDPAQLAVPNARLRDVRARTAIRSVLAPFNLHYVIIGDTVVLTTEEMALYRRLKQQLNIDLDRVEFAVAVKGLSRDTGVNLILDPRLTKEAQTKVTLQAEDLALESAVRMLCEMAGLKPVRIGNALYITSKGSATELRGEPELAVAPRQTLPSADDNGLPPRVAVPAFPGVPAAAPAAPAPPPAVAPK
jgi:hypothetical protein